MPKKIKIPKFSKTPPFQNIRLNVLNPPKFTPNIRLIKRKLKKIL